MIDYARMAKAGPRQKSALTRARKKGYLATLRVCREVVKEWNEIGAWPDHWSMFQRALDDAAFLQMRATGNTIDVPRLEDLQ